MTLLLLLILWHTLANNSHPRSGTWAIAIALLLSLTIDLSL